MLSFIPMKRLTGLPSTGQDFIARLHTGLFAGEPAMT